MSDTKFPDAVNYLTVRRGDAYFHTHLRKRMVDAERVDAWIKRCIEDFPPSNYMDDANQHRWFDKWFGQFKEESE